MDVQEFEDLLDRFGGDLAVWPEALRREASALMANSPQARAGFRAMGELEALLVATRPAATPAPESLAARAMRHPQGRVANGRRRVAWGAATAAALVLGLALGNARAGRDESPDRVMAASFDSTRSIDVD